MRWMSGLGILAFLALTVADPVAAIVNGKNTEDDVNPVGEYSTMRQTTEHCSGYSVDLWDRKGRRYGVFRACAGLLGDVQGGLLENTEFDPKSGSLTFRTQLSTGSDYMGAGRQVPSQDVFSFKGRLTATSLKGTLLHTDQAFQMRQTTSERVVLKIRHVSLPRYRSLDEWQSRTGAALKKATR